MQIDEYNNRELIRRVENRTADLALTNLAPESDLFRRRMLGSDPILLAAAYDKRMQQRFPEQCGNITSPIPIDLSTLQDETLIILHPWQNMRIAADAVCRHYDFTPKNTIEVSSLASAMSLVGSNRGMTFVPLLDQQHPAGNSHHLFFHGEMQNVTAIMAVFLKDSHNPIINKFCDCAAQSLKRI